MQFSQIKETCLYVRDLDQSEAFYHGKLGMEVLTKVEGRHVFFQAGSSLLLCFIADATKNDPQLPAHYGYGKMHLAFEVSRGAYENTKQWIQKKGITIEHEQFWHEDFYSFYFRDPDGHSLEVVPEGMWGL
ncbi:MAG: glyoxalase [Bacteroidetes bacterium SW_10_40_5]|nr:MAG: glyoxalase [Bacteroidetes bacterium SW_10_40_5]